MRQLIIHIGPGKSGSSALQSWLALNQSQLAALGFGYHVGHDRALAYRINAGNAGPLREMLREAAFPASEFERLYFGGQPSAIISGEQLQLLDTTAARRLMRWAGGEGVSVTAIGVLRNAYDYLYSSWLQTIKRRNQVKPFGEFIKRLKRFRHLDVVDHWEAIAPSRWIHYDTDRDRLAEAFCRRTGLDAAALTPMSPRRVNRSLTAEEAFALQSLVRWQLDAGIEVQDNFSRIISDVLVDEDPDRPVEFHLDEDAHTHMVKLFSEALQRFNDSVGAREQIRLSVLGETPHESASTESILDEDSLDRIVQIMGARREHFDPAALAVLASALANAYPELSAFLQDPR